jgi:hypothetical protein
MKKYNPFKMWGSYIGLAIATLFILFYPICYESICKSLGNAIMIENAIFNWFFWLIFAIGSVLLIISFLIGWGIHSLIRRLRR